jgi:hypothetical protein
MDGDGRPDDADGDGVPYLAQWRALPGDVPDPWFRARVGGEWDGLTAPAGACVAPFPFGPRAVPAAPASKPADRSGLFVRCPASSAGTLPGRWAALAGAGSRGFWTAEEDASVPDAYRVDGAGPALRIADVLPRSGGAVLLVPSPARMTPTFLALTGGRGAVLVSRGDLALTGTGTALRASPAPGDPRDTGGAERVAALADGYLEAAPAAGDCVGWVIGEWRDPSAGTADRLHACPAAALHWEGLVAGAGRVAVTGPFDMLGQLRAETLAADGIAGAVLVMAPAAGADPLVRPGPPGAPRVVATGVRDVP